MPQTENKQLLSTIQPSKEFKFFRKEDYRKDVQARLLVLANDEKQDEAFVKLAREATISGDTLIALCENSPALKQHFQRDSLKEHWLNTLNKLWISDDPKDKFYYKPHPNLHPLIQILGVRFYWQFLTATSDKEKEEFLQKAEEHGSFLASLELMRLYSNKLEKREAKLDIKELEMHAQFIAQTHLTPGHILAADYFLQIANYYHAIGSKQDKERAICNIFYHLYMAQRLVPVSEVCIHNSYLGADLTQAFNSNLTGYSAIPFVSWELLIQYLKSATKIENNSELLYTINYYQVTAKSQASAIISAMKPSENTVQISCTP